MYQSTAIKNDVTILQQTRDDLEFRVLRFDRDLADDAAVIIAYARARRWTGTVGSRTIILAAGAKPTDWQLDLSFIWHAQTVADTNVRSFISNLYHRVIRRRCTVINFVLNCGSPLQEKQEDNLLQERAKRGNVSSSLRCLV